MQANTVTNKALQAITATDDDGNVGVGVAVAYMNDTTTAAVNGPVSSGGDTLVQANEVKNGFSGTKFFFLPTLFTGVAVNTGTGNDDTGDLLLNMQGAATTVRPWPGAEAVQLDGQQQFAQQRARQGLHARLPGGRRGGHRRPRQHGHSDHRREHRRQGRRQSDRRRQHERPAQRHRQFEHRPARRQRRHQFQCFQRLGGGGDRILHQHGHLQHRCGAQVDAAKTLKVTSEALNDFQYSYDVNVVQAIGQKPTFTTTDSGSNNVTVNPGNIVEVESNDSSNGTVGHWYQYIGAGTLTNVNLTTQSFSNTNLWNDLAPVGNILGQRAAKAHDVSRQQLWPRQQPVRHLEPGHQQRQRQEQHSRPRSPWPAR